MNKKEHVLINCNMTPEQHVKFDEFISGDDLDFYEEYVINLSDEGQQEFFNNNPEFMSEFPVSRDRIYLLKDKTFRGILRKIKKYKRYK